MCMKTKRGRSAASRRLAGRPALEAGRSTLSSTHKLHDFNLRACLERRAGPLRLLDDPPVEFNRHPRGVQLQLAEEGENREAVRNGLRFAIHLDLDGHVG